MIDLSLVSPFRRQVYEALIEVPVGKVITYRELGERIGCRSAQAIGQALKNNPFAPEVPCHRVIKSDGTIGGYHGDISGEQIQRKLKFLAEEGVRFDEQGILIDSSCLL